jgi:hypothetical protein
MSDGRAVIGARGKALTAADIEHIGKVSNAATGAEGGANAGIRSVTRRQSGRTGNAGHTRWFPFKGGVL